MTSAPTSPEPSRWLVCAKDTQGPRHLRTRLPECGQPGHGVLWGPVAGVAEHCIPRAPTWLSLMPLNVVILQPTHPMGHPLSTSVLSLVFPAREAWVPFLSQARVHSHGAGGEGTNPTPVMGNSEYMLVK